MMRGLGLGMGLAMGLGLGIRAVVMGLWSRGLGLWGPRAVAGFVAVPVAGEATGTGREGPGAGAGA